jgi:hypothetical protein
MEMCRSTRRDQIWSTGITRDEFNGDDGIGPNDVVKKETVPFSGSEYDIVLDSRNPLVRRILQEQQQQEWRLQLQLQHKQELQALLLQHQEQQARAVVGLPVYSVASLRRAEAMLDLPTTELNAMLATMPGLRPDQIDQIKAARRKKRNRMYARRSRARKTGQDSALGIHPPRVQYSQKIGALKTSNAVIRSRLETAAAAAENGPPIAATAVSANGRSDPSTWCNGGF